MSKEQYWEHIYRLRSELNDIVFAYWTEHSGFSSWQFWTVSAMLVLPIAWLWFAADRRRLFEIFFFGYTVHMLWSYTVTMLDRYNLFVHQYAVIPTLPFGLSITASIFPVSFLLLYQHCTDREKNFPLYAVGVSAVFSFGFANIERALGFLDMRGGMNSLYLLLIDLAIVFVAYGATKLVRSSVRRRT